MKPTLFEPDNFSLKDIRYKKWNGNFAVFEEVFKLYFPKFNIKEILQLDRSEINSENFQISLSVNGLDRKVLLRKNKILSEWAQATLYLDALVTLSKSGVGVSRVVSSLNDERAVKMNNEIYSLFDFIDGCYFSPTEKEFEAVAKEISKMHQGFRTFSEKQISDIDLFSKKSGIYYNKVGSYSKKDFLEIGKIIASKQRNSEDELVLNSLDFIIMLVGEVEGAKKEIASLPRQIIHSDLHPHNILMTGNNVSAIVDFDGMRLSQRARDVVFAIYKFGRQFLINSKNEDGLSRAPALTKLFIDSYNKVDELSEKEIQLMHILIKDEVLTRLLFVLNGIYKENHFLWAKDLSKYIAAINEINYFWPNESR